MKKKVAIFASGWNSGNLYRFVDGMLKSASPNSVDYFIFICHATYTSTEAQLKSHAAIFDLPDIRDFDGVVIYQPGDFFKENVKQIMAICKNANIPVFCMGEQLEGAYQLGVDNYVGMKQLADHLIEDHGVKNYCFIAGSKSHAESNMRLEAVRDSFAEHGLEQAEKYIYYSDWELPPTKAYVYSLFEEGKEIPDAFICANDYLAEVVCFALEDNGLNVPKDVVITGFDFAVEGKIFYPAITTVDQRLEEAGRITNQLMKEFYDGKKIPMNTTIPCKMCKGESCGCHSSKISIRRREYTRMLPSKRMIEDQIEGRRSLLENSFIFSKNYDDLNERLVQNFEKQDGQEGNSFYVLFDPKLAEFVEKDVLEFPKFKLADELDVVVGKRNGESLKQRKMHKKELIPDYQAEGENHLYIISEMFYESFVCGYLVFCDIPEWILDRNFYKFEKSVMNALVLYRRNVELSDLNEKLSELLEKDSMTKVKNRMAFDRRITHMEEELVRGVSTPFAVAYFDVNNLKYMNDTFGHEKGDVYICNCCQLICDCFKHSPVYRIGGDEFVAILTGQDYDERKECFLNLENAMQLSAQTHTEPVEKISIASGMAAYDPSIDLSVQSVFKRADELMYERKIQMKQGRK